MALGKGLADMGFTDGQVPENEEVPLVLDFTKTTRENISNKLSGNIEELSSILVDLGIDENTIENEKILKLMDYILEEIYYSPEKREKEFQELKNNSDATHEEKTAFLEKENNMQISGEDWKNLIHCTGLLDWSMGKMGNKIGDRIEILKKISYFSLNATLRTGIHTGLGLQNIGKFFPNIRDKVFEDFKENPDYSIMLALTGLGSGSDLFKNVGVDYEKLSDGSFHLKGETHFQGLTNEATHGIVLAKNKYNPKEFKVFLVDTTKKDQSIEMTEEYDKEMLKSITYGKNDIDAIVHAENVSDMRVSRELPGMLNDSRLQFAAMLEGISKRIEDETRYKIKLRDIADGKMEENRVVQDRFKEIKNRRSIINLINRYLVFTDTNLGINRTDKKNRDQINTIINDLALANVTKAISTDYTVESARSAKVLQGGSSFKDDNLITNIERDSKPFSIFEGNNDMLYSQIVRLFKNKIELDGIIPYIGIGLEEIKDLDINDSIKGEIYSNVILLSMINEMNLNSYYTDEINFLIDQTIKLISGAKNIITSFKFKK